MKLKVWTRRIEGFEVGGLGEDVAKGFLPISHPRLVLGVDDRRRRHLVQFASQFLNKL